MILFMGAVLALLFGSASQHVGQTILEVIVVIVAAVIAVVLAVVFFSVIFRLPYLALRESGLCLLGFAVPAGIAFPILLAAQPSLGWAFIGAGITGVVFFYIGCAMYLS
jgi:hypothetical protein